MNCNFWDRENAAGGFTEYFEEIIRRGGERAISLAGHFFMGDDPVHQTLRRLVEAMDDLEIPYAVCGGMALNAHGYRRATNNVNLILTREALVRAGALTERGFTREPKGNNLRDNETGVQVQISVAGQSLSARKTIAVSYPDPRTSSVEIAGVFYVRLPVLMELKLASGMANSGRLKDLGDAQELIKALDLPEDFEQQLNPFVREKYVELWRGAQQALTEEDLG